MSGRSLVIIVITCLANARGQTLRPPIFEGYEEVVVPALPDGWKTSSARSAGGDFTTTSSAVYAGSAAVLSTNATVEQWLATPVLDFSGLTPDSLSYYERRSGTHNSGLLIEAAVDGGDTFGTPVTDTLRNPGTTAYIRRSFRLPAALGGQSAVRLRFRVTGDGSGTTGTVRFDNILITARAGLDAAVEQIATVPAVPNAGESLAVTAGVANAGLLPLAGLTAAFYCVPDTGVPAGPGAPFATLIVPDTLPAGARSVLEAHTLAPAPGALRLTVIVAAPGDQLATNDSLSRRVTVGLPRRSVVVNEVMYAPLPGAPEWLEIASRSASEIPLDGWKVSNRTTSSLYGLGGAGFVLPAAGYAVVTKDSAAFRAAHPGAGGTILEAASLPTFFLNNSGDAAVIFDSAGALIDTVRYLPGWGGQDGRSLERIEQSGESLDPSNWGSSDDSSGSTPGSRNSLTPLDTNLRLWHLGAVTEADGSVRLAARVRNTGRTPAASFGVAFGSGAGGGIIAETAVAGPLAPRDSVDVASRWADPPPGPQTVFARVIYPPDMRALDDTMSAAVDIPFGRSSIVINEIMYDPLAGDAEYVELYNRSPDAVDLGRWQLTDDRGHGRRMLAGGVRTVRSGGFFVVAGDSGVFRRFRELDTGLVAVPASPVSLNNGGDEVVLIDPAGTAVDSLRYLPDWHNPLVDDPRGRSLERISADLPSTDRRNWGTSADPLGGTPGARNSLQAPLPAADASLAVSPNPFSPDGDGHEDVAVVAYRLSSPSALLRVRVFDIAGRLIRVLADGEPAASRGELIWDGLTDRRLRAPIGVYVVLMEALGAGEGAPERAKGIVVVAGSL